MKRTIISIIIILVGIGFSSCSKEDSPEPVKELVHDLKPVMDPAGHYYTPPLDTSNQFMK